MRDIARTVGAEALEEAGGTPGLQRWSAFDEPPAWVGLARTEPGAFSGWHVHPGHDTFVYTAKGMLRVEFGADGAAAADSGPRSFMRIPRGLVHREGNPSDEPSELIVFRVGEGPLVENVDGPEPAAP